MPTAEEKAAAKAAKDAEKVKKDAEKAAAKAAGDPAPAPEKKKKQVDSLDVVTKLGKYVRTYSRAVHGDNFAELAQQLVSKHPHSEIKLIPSDEIEAVEVRYREKEDAELHIDKQDPNKPFVDKFRTFTDKEAAITFNIEKKGTIIVL